VAAQVGVAGVEAVALGEHHPAARVEARVGDTAAARAGGAGPPARADGPEADVVQQVAGQHARRDEADQVSGQRRPAIGDGGAGGGILTAALNCQPDWQRARPFRARRAADERRGQWRDRGCRLRDLAEVRAGRRRVLAPAEGNGDRIGGMGEAKGKM